MKIGWILAVCLAVRLIGINQSLWLDEAISANVVRDYNYQEIISKFSPGDFHPPLYYLILKGWTNIFGYSETSLRMPSIIFSLITIYIVYLLAGRGAAWLTGLNPLLIYYSQEVRMYAMVTMFLTVAIYFLVKRKYGWISLFLGLSFLTFYGAIFLIAAIGFYLLINKKIKELVIVGVGPIVALAILWPLFQQQLTTSKEMLGIVTNWDLVLGKANLKNLLLIPMKFSSGRISFYPKIVYYLVAGIWAGWVFKNLFKKNIYSFVFWMTLLIGTAFSIFTPMLQYFRFLYLIPIMTLIIKENKIMTIGFLIFSLVYLLNKNMWREDWKSLAPNLGNEVYMISSFGDPIKYYNQNVEINDIRGTINEKEIAVVPYGETIHGVNHKDILKKQGYTKTGEIDWREVTLEEWKRTETN